jgi:hypothetical protein
MSEVMPLAQKRVCRGKSSMALSKMVKISVAAISMCGVGGSVSAAGACDDQCLRHVIDQYLLAIEAHNPGAAPLASDARITLNGAIVASDNNPWKATGSLGIRRYAFDPETGNAVVQLILKNGGVPAIAVIRTKIRDGRITEVEAVLVQKDRIPQGIQFDDATFASSRQPEWGSVTPKSRRLPREELIKVAATYFTGLKSAGKPNFQPPWFSQDCNRFENGKQVTNVPVFGRPPANCSDQLVGLSKSMEGKSGIGITDERFVVADVERNIVVSFAIMIPPGPTPAAGQAPVQGFLIGDMFKIVNNKIKLVQVTYDRSRAPTGTGW